MSLRNVDSCLQCQLNDWLGTAKEKKCPLDSLVGAGSLAWKSANRDGGNHFGLQNNIALHIVCHLHIFWHSTLKIVEPLGPNFVHYSHIRDPTHIFVTKQSKIQEEFWKSYRWETESLLSIKPVGQSEDVGGFGAVNCRVEGLEMGVNIRDRTERQNLQWTTEP